MLIPFILQLVYIDFSQLNTGAKLLYMLVMFMGRVGPVSFAISLTSKPDDNKRKILPVGQINVG